MLRKQGRLANKRDWDPHEKVTQIQGGNSTRPLALCVAGVAAGAHGGGGGRWLRGQARGLAVAELEATLSHMCIDHEFDQLVNEAIAKPY